MFSNKFNIGVLKHPGYNVGGGIGEAALIGAAFGGAKSLATGEDVLEGALLGGITGGAMSGITGAVFGKEAIAGAAGATGEVAKNAVTPAITNTINAGANIADDVALATAQPSIAANQGLTGLSQNIGGINTAQGIGTNGVDFAGKLVDPRNLSTLGEAAVTQPQTFAQALATPGLDGVATTQSGIRGALGLKSDSLASQGLDFYNKQDLLTKAGLSGAVGFGMGALEPRRIPKLEEEEESKLAGYDPDNFTPYIPETPNPYYSAKYAAEGGTMQSYAQGGITALAQGGMGSNTGYPQAMLNTTQYATPTQMPTSAQVASADYELPIDPYMSSPLRMAEGGIAGYSLGGYAAGGNPRLLKGPGDGMSDNIPAVIGNRQPARLADGEFVVPADVVSHLGNGSTDAGAKHLYAMMDKVRTARTGKKAQGKQIKPEKFMPR
jgi:hypothetical protein